MEPVVKQIGEAQCVISSVSFETYLTQLIHYNYMWSACIFTFNDTSTSSKQTISNVIVFGSDTYLTQVLIIY